MNRKIITTIAKKEFFLFLNSPLAYVITIPFLLLSTFIYLRTSLVTGQASLRAFFELLPWFLILLAPALSMRLINEEQEKSTIELLLYHPISELDIVLGKFLGVLAFFLIVLATSLILPISLLIFANPDPGIIVSQYIGGVFMAATFLAIGVAASSYIKNPIGSFLLAASISFALIIIGLDFVTLMFPGPLSRIVNEVSILAHVKGTTSGLLDIRDILYFLTVVGFFLNLSVFKLAERRLEEEKREKQKLQLALGLILGIGVLLNVLVSRFSLRLDLTEQKIFTLSSGTKQVISALPDIVTISVFASRDLPAPLSLTLREIEDILALYQRNGKRIEVKTFLPDKDQEAASQARQAGIEEVAFNKIAAGKFEVQTGFLGLSIRFGDKTEAIPFVQNTGDLEYQLTRRIRKLTTSQEQVIGVYQSTIGNNQLLRELLQTQYRLENLTISDLQDVNKLSNLQTLIVIDSGVSESTVSSILKDNLAIYKKIVLLADGVTVNPQFLTAGKSPSGINDFLKEFGIAINNDLVYDLQLNETLTFGSGNLAYLVPYPFWLKAIPEPSDLPLLSGIKSVTLGWPSSLSINDKSKESYKKLLSTSLSSGKQEDNFSISPQGLNLLPDPGKENLLMAVLYQKDDISVIVIGDTDFATDEFLQNFPENVAFISNTIDFLASDKEVAAIPRKVASRAVFRFSSPIELVFFQYGNLFLPSLLVLIFAIFWLARRKKLTRRKYEK